MICWIWFWSVVVEIVLVSRLLVRVVLTSDVFPVLIVYVNISWPSPLMNNSNIWGCTIFQVGNQNNEKCINKIAWIVLSCIVLSSADKRDSFSYPYFSYLFYIFLLSYLFISFFISSYISSFVSFHILSSLISYLSFFLSYLIFLILTYLLS